MKIARQMLSGKKGKMFKLLRKQESDESVLVHCRQWTKTME